MAHIPSEILCDVLPFLKRQEFEEFRTVCRKWNAIINQSNTILPLRPFTMLRIDKETFNEEYLVTECRAKCSPFGHILQSRYRNPGFSREVQKCLFMEYDLRDGIEEAHLELVKDMSQWIGQRVKIHEIKLKVNEFKSIISNKLYSFISNHVEVHTLTISVYFDSFIKKFDENEGNRFNRYFNSFFKWQECDNNNNPMAKLPMPPYEFRLNIQPFGNRISFCSDDLIDFMKFPRIEGNSRYTLQLSASNISGAFIRNFCMLWIEVFENDSNIGSYIRCVSFNDDSSEFSELYKFLDSKNIHYVEKKIKYIAIKPVRIYAKTRTDGWIMRIYVDPYGMNMTEFKIFHKNQASFRDEMVDCSCLFC